MLNRNTNRIFGVLLLAIALLCCLPLTATSQPVRAANQHAYWAEFGFGGSFANYPGFTLGLSYQTGKHLFSARTIAVLDFGMQAEAYGDGFYLFESGLLYGLATRPGPVHVSISTGLSLVARQHNYGSFLVPTETRRSVGIPVAASAAIRPIPAFGISIYGFANINNDVSYAGLTINLQFGVLRPKIRSGGDKL